jgi:hypothetical protein
MNNAKCIKTTAGSQCVCQKGTAGILCEKSKFIQICLSIFSFSNITVQRSSNAKYCPLDCQAGGTCVYVKSTAKCRCPKGRTGRLCESRMIKNPVFLSIHFDLIFRFW